MNDQEPSNIIPWTHVQARGRWRERPDAGRATGRQVDYTLLRLLELEALRRRAFPPGERVEPGPGHGSRYPGA